MDNKNMIELMRATVSARKSQNLSFSYQNVNMSYKELNDTLRAEFNKLCPDYYEYQNNKQTIFRLLSTAIDDVLPQRVMEQYSQFADIKQFAQGEKPVFTQRISAASRRRAKTFITKVGLAGRYEVFKLDGARYEVPTNAIGGAAQIGFEEFLDGRITFADVLDIALEGLDEAIYREIASSLVEGVKHLQATNLSIQGGFSEDEMDNLLSIVDSYGSKATIYCTYEFAAKMIPDTGWVSDNMRDQKWNNGYLGNFHGHQVIVLKQSYETEANMTKVVNPAIAYIIANDGEKPVKVAYEGETHFREIESNEDWSKEIQFYKKVGVTAILRNNVAAYINTELLPETEKEEWEEIAEDAKDVQE